MKKKISIVCASQFGYLVDTFEYCRHLKDKYEITYICIDQNYPKIMLDGVTVQYHKPKKKGVMKWVGFVNFTRNILYRQDYILVKYFRLCSLIKLFVSNQTKVTLDVRTGAVSPSYLTRLIFDSTLKFESTFYTYITIVSSSLADQLRLSRAIVIPLGSPEMDMPQKSFDELNLLYVGTLSNRKIKDTVLGLNRYLACRTDNQTVTYDIVGDGLCGEVEELRAFVKTLGLDKVVNVHGRVSYDKLSPFFQRANIGVSYVPMVSYYNVQPVTKTLEYISCGMAVIGTSTLEQVKVINSDNGVLCKDDPSSFSKGLTELSSKRKKYNSETIKNSVHIPSWKDVAIQLEAEVFNTKGVPNA